MTRPTCGSRHVSLPERSVLPLRKIHCTRRSQIDAAIFEYLEYRHPIDTGRLHRHRGYANFHHPIGQLVKIGSERLKALHWLRREVGRHRHHMKSRTNIATCRELMNDRQS